MTSQPLNSVPTLDVIYGRIGHGPYHFFCLLSVGCFYLTESMLNIFTYVVAHAVKVQWNLNPTEVFLLLIARDVGIIIGACGFGWLGDCYGRLTIIRRGQLGRFCSIMISVMSLSYSWLLGGLFMMGFCLGVNRPAVSSFSIEILPIKTRGALLIGVFVFLTAGAVSSAALAIYLIPMFRPDNWRTLLFICAIPTIIGLLAAYLLFLEPPRYLAMIGKHDKAVKYLNSIAAINLQPSITPEEIDIVRAQPYMNPEKYSVRESLRYLFSVKYRRRLVYVLWMWFITGYQWTALMATFPAILSPYTHNPLMPIEISTVANAFFIPLPTVEKPAIGRRWTLMGFVAIQAFCCFFATLITHELLFMGVIMPFVIALTLSLRLLYPYTLELFETSVRCYAFGLCVAAARVGGLMSRWQPVRMHEGAVSVMLTLNFFGMYAVMSSPYETAGQPLEDYTREDIPTTDPSDRANQ